jgi:hypothetical protein
MPTENEIKSDGIRNRKWVICPSCNEGRWVILSSTKRPTFSGRCHACNASVRGGNRVKKGYRGKHSDGYVVIKLQPDDFFYTMSGRDGYVFEHRLVMAHSLGRCLHSWEIVHHLNHKRDDNRIENLQLVSDDRHKQISILEAKIARLQKEKKKLEERLRNSKDTIAIRPTTD